MNYLYRILLVVLLGAETARADAAGRIREQFQQFYTQSSINKQTVEQCLKQQRPDGTWPDLDYSNRRQGEWPLLEHLDRVEMLACAYAAGTLGANQQASVRNAVLHGLQHWFGHDYRNSTWWCDQIGIPKPVATSLILLGNDLPPQTLKEAQTILGRSAMGKTGQNKVWLAGIHFMKGLLDNNATAMKEASQAISSELRVSTEEGIQSDWSFHQHGPQPQMGNYGLAFCEDMIKWGFILRDTPYALAGEKLEILRNYLLEGPSWILWNGRMDLGGCGRQIDQNCQQNKGQAVLQQLEKMRQIDPKFKDQYEAVVQRIGFKPFWRSEMAVQRQASWYASVRMSSKRVIGAETCNSENKQGLHLGDGMLLIYSNGGEYEDIVPIWDWRRLPGTTCDQGFSDLSPKGTRGGKGKSEFSGVLGNGTSGIAAMIYQQDTLEARKAWFFLEDHIVCMGAGICGKTQDSVVTSLQQARQQGEVEQGEKWVHHAGVGYQVLFGKPETSVKLVAGNWLKSFPTRGNRPAEGAVFSMWIDHGSSPQNQAYAYRIFPGISANEMKRITEEDKSTLLTNSAQVQAIAYKGITYAVFYEAAKLLTHDAGVVAVDGPCLLILSGDRITVSDPTYALQRLHLNVDGKEHDVLLPAKADCGKQVDLLRRGNTAEELLPRKGSAQAPVRMRWSSDLSG